MKPVSLYNDIASTSYPGRGIVIGKSADGSKAVIAYFIMGRSENSRNRVFAETEDGIKTQAFDPSKLVDPSLIIYSPVRVLGNKTIVTNGDQTDTVYDLMNEGQTFGQSLTTREFEPDGPNYTPRISGIVECENGKMNYAMSILKSADGNPDCCERYTFTYDKPINGLGRFIHTYMSDGNPLPSFEGEPTLVEIGNDDIDTFAEKIWNSLNEDNKVSLFVRYIDIASNKAESRIINKTSNLFSERMNPMNELALKYGCNPNQKPSRIFMQDGKDLPVEVLNGKPGYINFLDAFNSWQLVKELKAATGLPAAASFKHVSPAGAAVATELSDTLKKIYFVDDLELSPIASAYAMARGADRMSSYGDWVALSDTCDVQTAILLKREVSDGIIAPDYTPEALEVLKSKKKGNYNVVKIDPNYVPAPIEHKDVFGITFEQGRNELKIDEEMLLQNIVTDNKNFTEEAKRDLLVALITLKYTQSNSVCYAKGGQAIGVGAGQQSRIHCTRLAGNKADIWYLRQHPKVMNLPFVDNIRRPDRDNTIDVYISDDYEDVLADGIWQQFFKTKPEPLTKEEKKAWLATFDGVSLGSDAFFPFGDNIERAKRSGVKFVAQPGGSIRDDNVIETCNKYNMTMSFTGIRLFHH